VTASTTRRARERTIRPDGQVAVQGKRPRADVLWYPRYGWPSVLVRRTHDLDLARELALECWAAQVVDERPLAGAVRTGWWRTYPEPSTGVPAAAALDKGGRVVEWIRPGTPLPHGAGAGVEFRP
jgi:hypothetical protein